MYNSYIYPTLIKELIVKTKQYHQTTIFRLAQDLSKHWYFLLLLIIIP